MSAWFEFIPLLVVVGAALLVLVLEATGAPPGYRKAGSRAQMAVLSLTALAAAFVQKLTVIPAMAPGLTLGVLQFDRLSLCLSLVGLGAGALVVVAAVPALKELDAERGEVFALLLLGLSSWLTLVAAVDLLVVLVADGIFVMSTGALYALDRRTGRGAEAAMKTYVPALLWAVLFGTGVALLFLAAGRTDLAGVGAALRGGSSTAAMGAILVLLCVLHRMGAVPFSVSAVDTAHGGSSFAVMFARIGAVLGGSAVLVRIFAAAPAGGVLAPMLYAVAALSVLVPAIAALDQRDLDRVFGQVMLLQTGVVLCAIGCHREGAPFVPQLVTMLVGITVGIVGVGVARGFVLRNEKSLPTWERWAGVGRLHPLFALALLVCGASLTGLPGTAGFWARLEIAGVGFASQNAVLALAPLVGSCLASLVVIRLGFFFFGKSPDPRRVRLTNSPWRVVVLSLCAVASILLGVGSPVIATWLSTFVSLPFGS